MTSEPENASRRKVGYHHGELREALISATRQLLVERGAENFTLSDACKIAGVTTAAPYKHFRDREEILQIIVIRGFEELTAATGSAVQQHSPGTLAGIIAMGQAYAGFAKRDPAVFRLMFGQNAAIKQNPDVMSRGLTCFGAVINQVAVYCENNDVTGDARAIALDLWTFVHGAACLDIDSDYDKVAPGLDVAALIARTTPRLLG